MFLRGGRVIDPASGHEGVADLLIDGEVELSDGYETIPSRRSVSAFGCVRGGEWIPARPDGSFAVAA
jgi:predicted amidohydrolase